VVAWRSGHWTVEIDGFWFFFSPNGMPLAEEDGIIQELIDSTDFRVVEVKLNREGLCPRCQVKLPFKHETPWRKKWSRA
jgi:hypothetical protein